MNIVNSFTLSKINIMNVESVISVIKRRFNGGNFSRSTKLQNKETKLKDVLYNIYRAIQIF